MLATGTEHWGRTTMAEVSAAENGWRSVEPIFDGEYLRTWRNLQSFLRWLMVLYFLFVLDKEILRCSTCGQFVIRVGQYWNDC